ncbi:MAG: hypothetical protein J0G28_12120 [Afipia sp.]|nr:hypothetical protein [Afipia sp.]
MVKKPLIEVTSFTDCEHRLPAIVGESECRYPPSLDTAAHGFSPLASLFPTCGMADTDAVREAALARSRIPCFVMSHAALLRWTRLKIGMISLSCGGHFADDTDHGQGS